jgi:hypothetical protein
MVLPVITLIGWGPERSRTVSEADGAGRWPPSTRSMHWEVFFDTWLEVVELYNFIVWNKRDFEL